MGYVNYQRARFTWIEGVVVAVILLGTLAYWGREFSRWRECEKTGGAYIRGMIGGTCLRGGLQR